MLWLPQYGITKVVTNAAGGYASYGNSAVKGTNLPVSGTTNTEGAMTEVISAANNLYDSWGIEIYITGTSTATGQASQAAVDIATGGATDDLIINDLLCGYSWMNSLNVSQLGAARYFFPVHIQAGVRVAARVASVLTTNANIGILIWLYSGGVPSWPMRSKVTTYGTPVNAARGQAVTPTASGGAASVTQMTASSSVDHFAFMPGFQVQTDTANQARTINLGIGIGAATEERIGTWWYGTNTFETAGGLSPNSPVFRNVPAGTRLTMLASNSGTNDAYDGLIYAV